ncbi:MAG: PD40 domain-containing protein [Phycisphaeraceae bacterium]|nr:PD40 domain-containing protein [Phycisphaeraceae bacterium]
MKRFAVTKSSVWYGAGVIAALVIAVGLLAIVPERYWTNGNEIKAAAAGAPIRRILWLPARPVAGMSEADQYEPKVSSDGLTMVFVRRRAGSNADLFESRWSPSGWGEARPIDAVNTESDELGPELSRDGTALYFYSDRAGGLGGYDLWVSKQVDGQWGAATNLGASVNSEANEYGPALSPDGKTLYFASNRRRPGESVRDADGWPATIREKRERHDYDLYRARMLLDGAWEGAAAVEGLNTEFDEGAPAMSPVGDFLYFASDRPGGLGGFDLYRSRVFADRIGAAENLGDAVNSADNDLDAGLSADGFRLYFSSDRARREGAVERASSDPQSKEEANKEAEQGLTVRSPAHKSNGERRYSLWSTASREVFVETEASDRLARLWNFIVPMLPWFAALLLALIPLALLIWMLRNEIWRKRLGRLSLLAQCLLISLLIHAAITAGLAVWKVGSGIADAMRSGGGTRVVLASAGEAGDFGGQVSGQLGAPATQTTLPMPTLSMIAADLTPAVEIAGPKIVELPAPLAPVTEKMATRNETATESSSGPVKTVELSREDAVRVDAAMPRTVQGDVRKEASAAAERVELSPAPSVTPSLAIRAPELAMPRSEVAGGTGAEELSLKSPAVSASESNSDVSARSESASALPAASVGASAALPSAKVMTMTEASGPAGVGGPTNAPSGVLAAPTTGGMSALPRRTELALPASNSGGALPAIPRASVDVAAGESSEPGVAMNSERLGRAESVVGARLPQAGGAKMTGEERGSASLGELARGPAMSAGVGAKIEAPVMALPVGNGGVSAERLKMEGFGGASEPREIAGVGGTAVDSSALGALSFGDARLPAEIAEPVKPIDTQEQRNPESRGEMLAKMGGSAETERAVGTALEWFAKHQEADGRWSGKKFDAHCGECGAPAEIDADAAMTGIVLLCYLGAGHTHMADGPYRENIVRALRWLIERQEPSGDLRRGETMYGQTLSTVALCEALAMTKDQRLTGPARRAVNFVLNTAANGGPKREEDTSVLGWLVMTVESARRAGIAVPRDVFDAAGKWLESASSGGRYSYRRGEAPSAAMTAEAMFVQQILGHSRDEARMRESAEFILSEPPKWDGAAPTYHWYYATLALFQQQGEAWEKWNRQLSPILVEHQRRDGGAAGSWDPQDEWSRLGGRLYQTAVCTLSLEVYYRYKAK